MNSGTVFAGSCGVHHHHLRYADDAGDRRRVAQKIEIEMLIERGIDGVCTGDQKQRVAVGRRLHRRLGRDVGAGAGPIIDDELLAEPLRQPFRRQPRHGVGGTAGRKAAQDVHRTRRIGVRARQARQNGQSGCACGKAQKIPAAKSHGYTPAALPSATEATGLRRLRGRGRRNARHRAARRGRALLLWLDFRCLDRLCVTLGLGVQESRELGGRHVGRLVAGFHDGVANSGLLQYSADRRIEFGDDVRRCLGRRQPALPGAFDVKTRQACPGSAARPAIRAAASSP